MRLEEYSILCTPGCVGCRNAGDVQGEAYKLPPPLTNCPCWPSLPPPERP
jgi:hypothetical protein